MIVSVAVEDIEKDFGAYPALRGVSLEIHAGEAFGLVGESGCPFHTRCPRKLGAICEEQAPPWRETPGGRRYWCHIPVEDLLRLQSAGEQPQTNAAIPGGRLVDNERSRRPDPGSAS